MNKKKKARRARGLGSDSGLNLAISRFTNSLGHTINLTTSQACFFRPRPSTLKFFYDDICKLLLLVLYELVFMYGFIISQPTDAS
jgi:hypothetical protein